MPTGYTAKLYDGQDQTFEEFVLSCARAFGALITLRDTPEAPIPDKFEPSSYYEGALEKDIQEIADNANRTDEQWEAMAEAEHQHAVASWEADEKTRQERGKRYMDMLDQVQAWIPPTPDHQSLKNFMAEQINDSIRYDCTGSDRPRKMDASEFAQMHTDFANRSYERHQKSLAEERERAKERTEWVRALKASLGMAVG